MSTSRILGVMDATLKEVVIKLEADVDAVAEEDVDAVAEVMVEIFTATTVANADTSHAIAGYQEENLKNKEQMRKKSS